MEMKRYLFCLLFSFVFLVQAFSQNTLNLFLKNGSSLSSFHSYRRMNGNCPLFTLQTDERNLSPVHADEQQNAIQ